MDNEARNPETVNGQTFDATAEATRSAVSREVHGLLADIEDLVKSTTALTGEDLARIKVQLGERVAAVKQSATRMGGAIADGARQTASVTDNYVHTQPWAAIGVGAAAGFLLGALLARRA